MNLQRTMSALLLGLAVSSLILFAFWSLHPAPVDAVYRLFSSSPPGHRVALFPYYLSRMAWPTLILGVVALVLAGLLRRFPDLLADSDRPAPLFSPAWGVFLASLLALYFEILLIRWLSSEMRALTYFKNLTLICAFLGLGAGMLMKDKSISLLPYFAVLFGLVTYLGVSPLGKLLGRLDIPSSSVLFLFQTSTGNLAVRGLAFFVFITGMIAVQVILFLPFGQVIARWMEPLPPLRAYSINIAGSLSGLWLFSALSHFSLPSWSWFACGLGIYLAVSFSVHRLRLFVTEGIVCGLTLLSVIWGDAGAIWSPYYKIEAVPWYLDVVCGEDYGGKYYKELGSGKIPFGYALAYNEIYYINALNTSQEFVSEVSPEYRSCRDRMIAHNLMALDTFSPRDQDLLIVASGPGNDIAVALNRGARSVDAVDIDPVIIELGKKLHPQQPYADPRVSVYVDDARSFLQSTQKQYDYILFASLDAQTLLSGMSSIRLDNFIYTKEAIRAAKARLRPDGLLVIIYWGQSPFIFDRFEQMLRASFPEDQVWRKGVLYAAGPQVKQYRDRLPPSDRIEGTVDDLTVPTDNWPFLYLQSRHIPGVFFYLAFVLIALTLWLAYRGMGQIKQIDYGFLFLGAGFMLLETKSVTQMSLLYGSTWFVNTVVFSVILAVILLANRLASHHGALPESRLYVLLCVALIMGYLLKVNQMLNLEGFWRHAVSAVTLGLPFYFAALIFALKLQAVPRALIGVALGSNLIGATLGAIAEYCSLVFGIKFLTILAGAFYGLAFLHGTFKRSNS